MAIQDQRQCLDEVSTRFLGNRVLPGQLTRVPVRPPDIALWD